MWKKKLLWGKKGELTPLKYIQGDGSSQWITFPNIFPDQNTVVECVATALSFGTGQQNTQIFGAGSVAATDGFFALINSSNSHAQGRVCGNLITSQDAYSLNTQYVIHLELNKSTFNDEVLTQTGSQTTATSEYPLTIFRVPFAVTGGVSQIASIRAWNKSTGVLLLDAVPMLDTNNTPCFLDRVANKPYYNEGTGDFEYEEWLATECDYVYADGNAYINSLYYGDENTATEVYCMNTEMDYRIAVGSRTNATNNNITSFVCDTNGRVVQDFGNYTATRQTTQSLTAGNYVRCYNSKNERWIQEDGKSKETATTKFTGTVSTPTPIYFGYVNAGSYPSSCSNFKGNYKEGKLYQKGVTVRDLVPIIDENNAGGMYDKCLNVIFYSVGSSQLKGHFVENNVDYTVVQYITAQQVSSFTDSNNCPYIKTGIIPGYNKKTKMKLKARFATVDTSYEKFICAENVGGRFAVGQAGNSTQMTKFYFGLGAQNLFTNFTVDTNWHIFELDWATKSCALDGTTQAFTSSGEYNSTGDLWLNARNTTTYTRANRPGGSDTVYLKLWEKGKLAYNGIAVIRTSDNKAGLYEAVNKEFQTTAGTIDYTYTA